MKKNLKWIILGICTLLFAILLWQVKTNDTLAIDNYFYNLFVVKMRNDALTPLMMTFTLFGSAYAYGFLFILALIFIKDKKIPLMMFLNLAGSAVVLKVVKHFVARPRPEGFRLITETGFSFPSGHAMNAIVFYGFIIFLIYYLVKEKFFDRAMAIIISPIILCIGISRVYLGVHFASDVISGYLIGLIYLILFIEIIFKKYYKKSKKVKA